MKTSTKVKILSTTLAVSGFATGVTATPLIANDTLEGMPSMGTQIGDFLGNLAPGLFKFILLLGIGGGIVGLVVAIIFVVRSKAGRSVR